MAVIAPTPAVRPGQRRRDPSAAGGGRRSWWGPVFALPHAIGLALFTAVPILIAFVMSLYDWPTLGERTFTGLDNLAVLFGDETFRAALGNTVLFVVMYLPLNLVISMGIALWLSPKIRHRHIFRVIFFIPAVTPIVANVVVWRMLYQPEGFIDATVQTLFGRPAPNFLGDENWAMIAIVVMSVWQGFGYNMLVFSAALDSVPESQLEAASLDGANAWQIFWRVRLPLITPSIFFATTMTLITSFQVFVQPFMLTKGGPGQRRSRWCSTSTTRASSTRASGLAAAAAWVLFVIILGITAVQFLGQKKWVHYE